MKRKREEFESEHAEEQFHVLQRCIPILTLDLIHLVNNYAERQDDDIKEDLKRIKEKKEKLKEELFERKLRILTKKLINDIKANPTKIYLFNYKSLLRRPHLKYLADELITLTGGFVETKGNINFYNDRNHPDSKWKLDLQNKYDASFRGKEKDWDYKKLHHSQVKRFYFEIDPKDIDAKEIIVMGLGDEEYQFSAESRC